MSVTEADRHWGDERGGPRRNGLFRIGLLSVACGAALSCAHWTSPQQRLADPDACGITVRVVHAHDGSPFGCGSVAMTLQGGDDRRVFRDEWSAGNSRICVANQRVAEGCL